MKTHRQIYHLYKKYNGKSLLIAIIFLIVATLLIWIYIGIKTSVPFNTKFMNKDIGGMSKKDLKQRVEQEINIIEERPFVIGHSDYVKEYRTSDLGIYMDGDQTVEHIINDKQDQISKLTNFFEKKTANVIFFVDSERFWNTLQKDFGHLEKNPKNAQFMLSGTNLNISDSSDGLLINRSKLKQDITGIVNGSFTQVELEVIPVKAQIDINDAEEARTRVQELLRIQAKFTFGQEVWTINTKNLFDMLSFLPDDQTADNLVEINLGKDVVMLDAGFRELTSKRLDVALDKEKLNVYLDDIQAVINRPARDATLRFEGGKVVQFTSAQDGQELDLAETQKRFNSKLKEYQAGQLAALKIELPVKVTKAKIANKEINSLGIRELIGTGVSYFAGSIANRVHNIELGSSLINGTLVPPGENFSFVGLVGPVSADQGFKSAYVIKSGRTVLDDGGGICQVSTTVFRAALNSGLPIVKRTAHAYRVSYYEQRGFKAGLDATIFSPTVDLQFKNDTNHHILVQTLIDRANSRLQVDIYGTSDGRRVELSEPVVSNFKPAPEPKYEDDPTLQKGIVKQVDFAAAGATSVFSRKVFKENQLIIDDTFKSVYRPWQAVFLVGTAG